MRRYQQFIQGLNNIQKVCILHNMTMDSLDLVRGLASTLAWRREVAQAFHRIDGVEFGTGGTADMTALTPVNLGSVALIAAGRDDIAIGSDYSVN